MHGKKYAALNFGVDTTSHQFVTLWRETEGYREKEIQERGMNKERERGIKRERETERDRQIVLMSE